MTYKVQVVRALKTIQDLEPPAPGWEIHSVTGFDCGGDRHVDFTLIVVWKRVAAPRRREDSVEG